VVTRARRKGGGGYILVVEQGFVDSVEGCIHDDLVGDVVSFSMGGGFGGGRGWEVARNLALGLGVHGRDKLGCDGLPSLGFLLQVLPSFNIGGVCGMFGWWVRLGDGCFGGVGVCAGAGAVVGRRAVGVVFVLDGSLPLSLPFFLWVGAGVAWAPSWLSSGSRALCGREELLLHLGDLRAQRGDLLGQAVCGDLEGSVFWAKSTEISVLMVLANWSRRLMVMISMSARSATCSGLCGAAIWGAVLVDSSMSPSIACVAVTCSVCWKSMALSSSSSLPSSSESSESESESESVSFSSRACFAGEGDREAVTVGG